VSLRSGRTPIVGILGVGYMGIATGLGFAARGRTVVAYDIQPKVRAALRRGRSPYEERGLTELLRRETQRRRFRVVDSLTELATQAECIFLCVPTPPKRNGEVDLGPLRTAARELGAALRGVRGYRVVVVKSTVVPGTVDEVVEPLVRRASGKDARTLGIGVNPEFLSEGRMVEDAVHPARIVIGSREARARRRLRAAYDGFPAPVVELSPAGAELVKHASNEFLALKVSYANELARWSERLGTDVDAIVDAIGGDPRIGKAFLRAGPGFGGSCFDKDLRAFDRRGEMLGVAPRIPRAVLAVNDDQTAHAFDLVRSAARNLRGKNVAVLGLAFKVGTDDVRESRAFPIVERLVAAGARVRVHDPTALANFRREWERRGSPRGRLVFARSARAALSGADVAVLQADWPEYREWPSSWTRAMRRPVLVDLRRGLDSAVAVRSGLRIVALGRGSSGTASRASTADRRGRR
jgi:UDPglucose 6-dehydrogenase